MSSKAVPLKAVANDDGTITIKGTVATPNPGYSARLVQERDAGINLVLLSGTGNGARVIQVLAYRDVEITINDVGQEYITVTTSRNGNSVNSERLFVKR